MKRFNFIRDVEARLACRYGPEEIAVISNMIVKALEGYEMTTRCTDLVVHDDVNDKLIRRFRACLLVDGKSEATAYQYVRTIRKMVELLRKPIPEVGPYDIRYFLAMEKDRGVSQRTLENTRANLSAFYQWLANEEVIQKSPLANIKPIKYAEEVRAAFSDVELDALRSACRTKKERALIEILVSTGIRVSELAGMKVEDINQTTLAVHVIHGKGAKERVTYTTPVCLRHLITYLKQRPEDGPALFYNKNHLPIEPGGIRHILNEIGKRAGVDNVHPHRFRRTFATNLSKRGMEIQEIQKLLGHSSIDTTLVYVSTDDMKVLNSYRRASGQ